MRNLEHQRLALDRREALAKLQLAVTKFAISAERATLSLDEFAAEWAQGEAELNYRAGRTFGLLP